MKRYFCTGFLVLTAVLLVLSIATSARAAECPIELTPNASDTTLSVSCEINNFAIYTHNGPLTLDQNVVLTRRALDGVVIIINGNFVMSAGSEIDADNPGSCPRRGHAVTLDVKGNITMEAGPPKASIHSNSCSGGDIDISSLNAPAGVTGIIDIDGLVESMGSTSGTGAIQAPGGGPITILAKCDLTITDDGKVSSRGRDPGADLVTLWAGCKLHINGLVESTGAGHALPNSPFNHCGDINPASNGPVNGHTTPTTACVLLVAGDELIINGILTNGGPNGEVNADLKAPGKQAWIDIFTRGGIQIINNYTGPFAVHADNKGATNLDGGLVTVRSSESFVFATGFAISASTTGSGGQGGTIDVTAYLDVNLNAANPGLAFPGSTNGQFVATGSTAGSGVHGGGTINILSQTLSILAGGGPPSTLNVTGSNPLPNGTVNLTACIQIQFPLPLIPPGLILPGPAAGPPAPTVVVTRTFTCTIAITPIPPLDTVRIVNGLGVIRPLPPIPDTCPCVPPPCVCVKATLCKDALTSNLQLTGEGLDFVSSPGISVIYSLTCDPISTGAPSYVPALGGLTATATPGPVGPTQAKVILLIPGCGASLCLTAPTNVCVD